MSSTLPPLHFNEAFLDWFRECTETYWSECDTITLDPDPNEEIQETDCFEWQQGTRWLPGLTEAEITAIEKRWNISFPPDYRLFLHRLHAPDRPRAAIFPDYDGDGALKLFHYPSFYNWLTDDTEIQDHYDALVDGRLIWDTTVGVVHPTDGYSLPGTGKHIAASEERKRAERTRFQELVRAAPKLIPVFGHQYLLAEPCQAGNPILSIYQSDIVVYGATFREYLINEFLYIIDEELFCRIEERGEFEGTYDEGITELSERYHVTPYPTLKAKGYADIPFWGKYLSYNGYKGFSTQYAK